MVYLLFSVLIPMSSMVFVAVFRDGCVAMTGFPGLLVPSSVSVPFEPITSLMAKSV